jgi:hypothetical protein
MVRKGGRVSGKKTIIPKMLRLFFRFKRKLLDSLCLSAVTALLKFFHTATDLELRPGVVAVIQTFGDRINFHPHVHVLITEGVIFHTKLS